MLSGRASAPRMFCWFRLLFQFQGTAYDHGGVHARVPESVRWLIVHLNWCACAAVESPNSARGCGQQRRGDELVTGGVGVVAVGSQ